LQSRKRKKVAGKRVAIKGMRRRFVIGILIGVVVIVVTGWVFCRVIVDPITGFDYQADRRFRSIRSGMTKEKVLERMGEPKEESRNFPLSQYNGFEDEYKRAEASGSAYYLFWHGGIDITYAVGFNSNNLMTIKVSGGT